MPGFALTNLKELQDSAPVDEIEGRFGRKHLGSEHLGVSYFRYAPGFRASVELRQWDALRVAPEVVRGFEAGPDGLELIAVGSDRPEGGDGEMVRDWWTD